MTYAAKTEALKEALSREGDCRGNVHDRIGMGALLALCLAALIHSLA